MSLQKERLISLIDFAQQAARLNSSTVKHIDQHKQFKVYEHELLDLPGVKFNEGSVETGDELWLSIARLQETKPPAIDAPILLPWVEIVNNPAAEPKLRPAVLRKDLSAASASGDSAAVQPSAESALELQIEPDQAIALSDYEKESAVRSLFKEYVGNKWKNWAELELRRRKTIRLYSSLFTLQQQMLEGVVEAPLEIVWGVGMGIWTFEQDSVTYPLVTRVCELALNPITAAVEVRPRDADPRLETDWYASVDNQGLGALEKTGKEFFSKVTETFSPFYPSTFEPLLQAAVTHLDPNGVYWPTVVPSTDRALPKSDSKLQVTDTWVLFARPRTNSAYLADLEIFKKK